MGRFHLGWVEVNKGILKDGIYSRHTTYKMMMMMMMMMTYNDATAT
jgi:hypothetical protein